MAEIDLNVVPLYLQGGEEYTTLPGLHVAAPSNKASRSRRNDRLILLLDFVPSAFSDDRLAELLTRLEAMYFEKSGSTTSAMRELIEDLNTLILNLNIRHAGSREQVLGTFGVIVIRNDHFFLAQCGEGHLFALLPGKVDYLHDENLAGRGLGVGRSPSVFYAQLPLEAGYKFIFAKQLPETWDAETFQHAYTHPLHSTRRRFLEDSGEDLKGLMLSVTPGRGKLTLEELPRITPKTEPAAAAVSPPDSPAAAPAPEPQSKAQVEPNEPAASTTPQPATPPNYSDEPAQQAEPESSFRSIEEETYEPAVSGLPLDETPAPAPRRHRRARRERESQIDLKPALLNILKSVQNVGQRLAGGLKSVLQRLVPGEELVKIPSSYMAFIAIFVPLIVVTISALVYAQVGRNQQYEFYLSEAQSAYQIAEQETDPNIKHDRFEEAMAFLDRAESYLITDELGIIRAQTQEQLDLIDNISRLDFEPAIAGTLANQIKIRRIAATSRDVYLLDTASDSVFRAGLRGTQFEMDSSFRCSAGPYGSIIVKGLVDIAILPENPDNFRVVAIDSGGNLLYCKEDTAPTAIAMIPPDSNWGEIKGITIENERLYVLDEKLNMLWYYNPSENENNVTDYRYRGQPNFFFVEEVPSLKDSIDFAIDREELYLLYLNGQTTTCTFSGLDDTPTTCTSPAEYNDTRPGKQAGPTIEGAVFYQMQNTDPPEPSLYYLDPVNSAIYHFSLRLNLVEQYRPQPELEEETITAFAISPTRTIFIALDNEVYLAYLP